MSETEARESATFYGDLCVTPYIEPTPELVTAFTVIGDYLRPICDEHWPGREIWKDGCVAVSLIIRDFLFRVGFTEAEVRPCAVAIEASRAADNWRIHTAVIGMPGEPDKPDRWNGHLVVVLPKMGWMIDGTLCQAHRDAWKGLPGMIAIPTRTGEAVGPQPWGKTLAAFMFPSGSKNIVRANWIDQPENKRWRNGPVAMRGGDNERFRRLTANHLIAAFNQIMAARQ